MKEAVFAIIDVILILCACIFTSLLSIFLVRDSDPYVSLTSQLTIDRTITICKEKDSADASRVGGNLSLAYATSLHTMCAFGEVYHAGRFQCAIDYLPHDSYNALLVSHAFSPTSDLRMHACGRRLEALAAHASGLQYTLIRSDAALASSVDAVMLQRLSNSPLRTNMLQKRVHWCVQEQSLTADQLLQNVLSARAPLSPIHDTTSALRAMADLSVRGCPSVAHVGVGMRGDGYAAVLQYRPLPTVEQARRVHRALRLPFDEDAYARARSVLAANSSYDAAQTARYAYQFVNFHVQRPSSIPMDRIEVGVGSALYAYAHYAAPSTSQALVDTLNNVCVFSVAAGGYAHMWDAGLVQSLRSDNPNGGMHRAARLDTDVQMRFDSPTRDEFAYATTPNVLSLVDYDSHDCVHTVRHFFTDAYEAFVFQTLVSPTLHDRIHALFALLQREMQSVLQYSTIQALFNHQTTAVQRLVQRATLHLVGETPSAASTTPVVVPESPEYNTAAAMLSQARRVTTERLRRVHDQSAPCAMAPLFGSGKVTTNAYFLHPFGCIVVGSGVLLRPFADESYSNSALLMGIGFVMAHELGHALLAGTVDKTVQAKLFSAYPTSTYEEAIADLLGALTVLRIHGSREDMCVRLQQVWCVHVDKRDALDPNPSHPYPHLRWADLCALMHDMF